MPTAPHDVRKIVTLTVLGTLAALLLLAAGIGLIVSDP
jgi:hypothetical protein